MTNQNKIKILILIAMIAILIIAAVHTIPLVKLKSYDGHTEAVICEIETRTSYAKCIPVTSCRYLYEFSANGTECRNATAWSISQTNGYEIGSEILVSYSLDNPNDSMLNMEKEIHMDWLKTIGTCAILLLIIILLLTA